MSGRRCLDGPVPHLETWGSVINSHAAVYNIEAATENLYTHIREGKRLAISDFALPLFHHPFLPLLVLTLEVAREGEGRVLPAVSINHLLFQELVFVKGAAVTRNRRRV